MKRKRANRDEYCSTPPFAKNITKEDVRKLSEALEAAGKAKLFVSCLKGNNYAPCSAFETSCNRISIDETPPMNQNTNATSMEVNIFANMSTESESSELDFETLEKIELAVGVSLEQCKLIEAQTRGQSSNNIWYFERSRRITASIFGRIMNRREHVFPKSIIDKIVKRGDGK